MTNFEKIKEEITIEKMAKEMSDYYDCDICPCRKFCDNFEGVKCSKVFEEWLKKDIDILDEMEKEYLRNVLRPFLYRTYKITVTKERCFVGRKTPHLNIVIRLYGTEFSGKELDDCEIIDLPMFHSRKMYAGMELEREYTVEELGLR